MKQEFKKGDRVLVRSTDLQEWIPAVFHEMDDHFFVATIDGYRTVYGQCRHIDDFRTGDKVQVRDDVTHGWLDAIYAVYVPGDGFDHTVFFQDMSDLAVYKLCRWNPSMPWADKEEQPLTLEQRVEALERKLNEQ